jgi:S-DNA-T family DNA segregation ATPase FtsK/SpoIIIE
MTADHHEHTTDATPGGAEETTVGQIIQAGDRFPRDPDPDPDSESLAGHERAGEVKPKVFDADILDADYPMSAVGLRKRGLRDLVPARPRAGRALVPVRVTWRFAYKAAKGGARVGTRAVKAGAKAGIRAGTRVASGHRVAGHRFWHAVTLATYDEQIRRARAEGDHDQVAAWVDRKAAAKRDRHRRMIELPRKVWGLTKLTGIGLGVVTGLIVVVAPVVIGFTDSWQAAGQWFRQVGAVLRAIAEAFTITWDIATSWWAAVGAAIAWLLLTYATGRDATVPPWARTAGDTGPDLPIDESTITAALKALRIPAINDWLKQGLPLQYLTPARKDGRGTHAVVRLPGGVAAEKIAGRRPDLASGLHRRPNEVWLTMGDEAGILDLWVANKGALAEGSGPYPLLDEGTADWFKGVPFGKTLRGEPLLCPLRGRNTIIGGMPDQGKSSAGRVIVAGASLDPRVEIRVYIPDANYDYESFKPRLARYLMGAEPELVTAIADDLQGLVGEIQRRGELLIEHEEPEVTPALANADVGLHPILVVLEEAHIAFREPRVAEAVETVVRLGRKRAIHMITSTQATTGNSVPPGITMNSANAIAFAVARWQENDALLGQGAYAAGHRATDLIPGTDKGNAVVRGMTEDRSVIAQAYFVSVSRERDQVKPIVDRAMAAIAKRGKGVPGKDNPPRPVEPAQPRDLLVDLDEVLGSEPVPIADVPALLRDLAPHWAPYRSLTGKALRERLAAEHGVKVPSTGNKYPLDPVTVRKALARRATADLDGET